MKLSVDRFMKVVASLGAPEGAEATEQRRQPRVAVRASVIVAPLDDAGGAIAATYSVRLADLSCEGVSFRHYRGLKQGSQFVLDLPEAASVDGEGSPDGHCVRLLCRVVHTHPAGVHQFVIGAQFVRLWTAPAPELDAARAAAAA